MCVCVCTNILLPTPPYHPFPLVDEAPARHTKPPSAIARSGAMSVRVRLYMLLNASGYHWPAYNHLFHQVRNTSLSEHQRLAAVDALIQTGIFGTPTDFVPKSGDPTFLLCGSDKCLRMVLPSLRATPYTALLCAHCVEQKQAIQSFQS